MGGYIGVAKLGGSGVRVHVLLHYNGGLVVGMMMMMMMMCWIPLYVGGADDTLATECSASFQKLPACLDYTTGKASDPTKECCQSASSIRDSKPVCLCYIIQQINTGTNSQLKSLGIQEAKLLALPSACKLTNASLSDCPKLLNIPANSAGAAIFKDPKAAVPSAPTSAGPEPVIKGGESSNGIKLLPLPPPPAAAGFLNSAIFLFFCAFILHQT